MADFLNTRRLRWVQVIRTEQKSRRLRDDTASCYAALTLTYMTAGIVGGIWTGSLALIADAAHMATDAGGLGLALLAIYFAQQPATPQKPMAISAPRTLPPLSTR